MSSDFASLFTPLTIRGVTLQNRIVMAPMTRGFSPGGVPTKAVADYYHRRAGGGTGLISSVGAGVSQPAAIGAGSFREKDVPLLYGDPARAGWQGISDAVPSAGSAFMPQLWHMGVMRPEGAGSHPEAPSLSPSGTWGPLDRTVRSSKNSCRCRSFHPRRQPKRICRT